jgi:hypothetical protein
MLLIIFNAKILLIILLSYTDALTFSSTATPLHIFKGYCIKNDVVESYRKP